MEWLIGLLGLALGAGIGYLLARRAGAGGQRLRELEDQLNGARQELEDYRHEVVTQFSETARKFQTLNDSYTDLHQQLAKSSSILCGDLTGPLLAAPAGHQDLLPAAVRSADGDGPVAGEPSAAMGPTAAAEPAPEPAHESEQEPPAAPAAEAEPPTLRERVERAMPPTGATTATAPRDAGDAGAATSPPPPPDEAIAELDGSRPQNPIGTDIRVAEPAARRSAAPFQTRPPADHPPAAEPAPPAAAGTGAGAAPAGVADDAAASAEAPADADADGSPAADRRAAG